MKLPLSLCLLAVVSLPQAGIAAGSDNLMQDVFVLDPIEVTGRMQEDNLDRTTAIVVEKNRSNNVADYLVRDPEISFKRKAAMGDSSDIISIRGMESKRIMLNLDGRNISSTGMSGGNYIDFGAAHTVEDALLTRLLANAAAWDSLSADDHAMLAHLPAPHGPVFAWLEAQLHEHGPQPWAALREGLRGEAFEAYVCAEVEQATIAADSASELEELAGVMDLLRRDDLMRQSQALSLQAATDPEARERLREVNERIKALKPGSAL